MSKFTEIRDKAEDKVNNGVDQVEDIGKKAGNVIKDTANQAEESFKAQRDSTNEAKDDSNNNNQNEETSLFHDAAHGAANAYDKVEENFGKAANSVERGFQSARETVHNIIDSTVQYEENKFSGENEQDNDGL